MKFNNPTRDIQDMVGLRVVCLYLSDIQQILMIVKDIFDFVREADMVSGANVSSFGYMSHHVIVQMKSSYKGPRYDILAGRFFEIQIRTILMDAWANVSHHLQYKSDSDVPKSLLRDFHALSGLFYVADTHFEMFFNATKESRAKMADLFSKMEPNKIDEEINLDSLQAYLAMKLADRDQSSTPDDVSSLVSELRAAGYETIAEVDEIYEQVRGLVFEDEQRSVAELGELNEKKHYYWAVGMIRTAFLIASEKYCQTIVNSWDDVDEETKNRELSYYRTYRQRLSGVVQ